MHTRFSKYFMLAMVLASVSILGFGCKGMSSSDQAAVQPVTLEYWTVYDDVNVLQTEINAFHVSHPFVTVHLRQIAAADIYDRLVEALAEDKGPDIISVSNKELGKYLSKLAPMPSAVRDTTLITTKNQFGNDTQTVNSVNRSLITPMQLGQEYVQAVKGDAVHNGKVYGLPLSLDTMGVYYNKDLLDRAGIPLPPQTWDEFEKDVEKLVKIDKNGKILQAGTALGTGANIPGSDDILYLLFAQSRAPFVDSSGKAVFNLNTSNKQPPAVAILNFYTDFANQSRTSYSWNDAMPNALDSFVNGSLAFFFGYSYHYPIIKARAPQLNFELLPMLQISKDNPVNVASYSLQTVLLKSKHQNDAWNLVDFLTHSSATKDYLDKTNRPTALRFYVAGQQNKPELAPFVSQALVATSWYKGDNFAAAQKALQDMVRNWIISPPNNVRQEEWQSTILNQTAEKINQTIQ